MISSNLNIIKPTYLGQEFSFRNKAKESRFDDKTDTDQNKSVTSKGLTEEEKKQVQALKKVDQKVRAHEQAHLSAAGGLSHGGATFTYTRGPDGKRYATSGEVQIELSAVEGDPKATIQKMQQVRRAALAPADPSAQDRSVAAKATREIAKANAELGKVGTEDKPHNKLDIYKSSYAESSFSQTV